MGKIQKLVLVLYVAAGCLTFASQGYVRLPRCAGVAACSASLAMGAIWSAAWPTYWAVYAYGGFPADQAAYTTVDADWYLAQYPDVRAAVQTGRFRSAKDHYRKDGFKENRLPVRPQVDEEYYLQANPDVAEAVRAGKVKSGYDHYLAFGYAERRKPSP